MNPFISIWNLSQQTLIKYKYFGLKFNPPYLNMHLFHQVNSFYSYINISLSQAYISYLQKTAYAR
jgi:hypothetical protein